MSQLCQGKQLVIYYSALFLHSLLSVYIHNHQPSSLSFCPFLSSFISVQSSLPITSFPSSLFLLSITSIHSFFPFYYFFLCSLHALMTPLSSSYHTFILSIFSFLFVTLSVFFFSFFFNNLLVVYGLSQFIVFSLPSFITFNNQILSVPLSIIFYVKY